MSDTQTLVNAGLVLVFVMVGGVFAATEIALVSLRASQLSALERESARGARVAEVARDPNRFLATIQIGITLAGFLASATAAVSLAEPLVPLLGFAGEAAEPLAIVLVTLVLAFVTLVIGELAPKRLALQRAESWAMFVAVPLHWAAVVARPLVWLLSKSTDFVVRLLGGEPGQTREEVAVEELRDLIVAHRGLSDERKHPWRRGGPAPLRPALRLAPAGGEKGFSRGLDHDQRAGACPPRRI